MPSEQDSTPRRSVRRRSEGFFVKREAGWEGAELPPFCVECGAPSTSHISRRYKQPDRDPLRRYQRDDPVSVVLKFVERAQAPRLELVVPLCSVHRARRLALSVAGWLGMAGAVAVGYHATTMSLNAVAEPVVLAVVMFVVGGLVAGFAWDPLNAVRIDDNGGVFKGAGEGFLQRLE